MKEALESTPEDCTEQSLAGHLDMQRGGFKEYGMVRGDMQDALAELYLWYRCRKTADKPAVDKWEELRPLHPYGYAHCKQRLLREVKDLGNGERRRELVSIGRRRSKEE